jgi:hypothetical protein
MKYPSDMKISNAEKKTSRWERKDNVCHATIVSLVQWNAGRNSVHANRTATTFPVYKEELKTAIETSPWQREGVVYNDVKNTCPPADHRSSPVIDGYKEIVRNLASEYKRI